MKATLFSNPAPVDVDEAEHHITLSSEPGHTYMARFLLSGHRREAVVVLPRDLSRAEAEQIAAIVAGLGAANEAPKRKESRCA